MLFLDAFAQSNTNKAATPSLTRLCIVMLIIESDEVQ